MGLGVYASHLAAGIISFIIGILLGAIHFFKHAKKRNSRWEIRADRLLVLGIPLLFVATFFFSIVTTSVPSYLYSLTGFEFVINDPFVQSIAQFVFGYVLVTSLIKKPDCE